MPDTIYTNRPEMSNEQGYTYVGTMQGDAEPTGLEVAPGVEYAPEKGWTLASVVRAFPDAFNIDADAAAAIDRGEKTELQRREEEAATQGMSLREYLNSDYGKMAAKYGKPPDNWNVPDYSEEGRNHYEQIVFKNIGGNPFQFDPNEEVNKSSSYLPTLFNQVFDGKILYEDRATMTKKQRDHWNKEKNKFRAYVYNDAVAAQKKMAQEYDWMMNKFDRQAKEFKVTRDKLDEKMNVKIDAFNPKTRVKRKMTVDEFNQARTEDPNWTRGTPMAGDAEDDGVNIESIQKLANFELKIFDPDSLVNGRVATTNLQLANRMRASLGLPVLEEVAGEEPKDWGPVQEWWEDNMPGVLTAYEYREKVPSGGKSPQGAQVVRNEVPEREEGKVTSGPTAINPDTGEQYEEGYRAMYMDPKTGARYRVVVKNGVWDYE